jgi:hypothetical protein
VNQRLLPTWKEPRSKVSVGITGEEDRLKEEHRCRPYGRAPAKPGEDQLADERLNLKQEEGADKNRHRKDKNHPSRLSRLRLL